MNWPMNPDELVMSRPPAFDLFYQAYAPMLWGLLQEAPVDQVQAETIFINTLRKVWSSRAQQPDDEIHRRSWFMRLAVEAGLPVLERRKAFMNRFGA